MGDQQQGIQKGHTVLTVKDIQEGAAQRIGRHKKTINPLLVSQL